MAIIDANNKAHSETTGQFVRKSTSEMKETLQRELPQESLLIKDAAEDEDRAPYGSQEELDELLGEEFKGVKGQAAVSKLLAEKRGHVKGAFHRDDIGDIDLFWGNDFVGLKHIVQQREKQGIDGIKFVSELSDIVEKGKYHKKNERGNFEFLYKGKMAIIAPEYHGNKITYVLTAYKTSIKNKTS